MEQELFSSIFDPHDCTLDSGFEQTYSPLEVDDERNHTHSTLNALESVEIEDIQHVQNILLDFDEIDEDDYPFSVIQGNCDLDGFSTKTGAYTASSTLGTKVGQFNPSSLEEALSLGLKLVKYTGETKLIADRGGRVIAAIVPPPADVSLCQAAADAFDLMEHLGENLDLGGAEARHKRGQGFIPLNTGLSYGIGHITPSIPKLSAPKKKAVESMLKSSAFQRLASFQNDCFSKWHPRAYKYYQDELAKLWEHHPELPLPLFPESIMPTAAFNIGQNVFTSQHIDGQNCPFGWCLITALGKFTSSSGGHIILWDLGLIVEFPAGSCVCIPSALITHSNIPAHGTDRRMSFTQYCPGEIFRYIENWFLTDSQLEDVCAEALQRNVEKRAQRKVLGFDMFLTLDELRL